MSFSETEGGSRDLTSKFQRKLAALSNTRPLADPMGGIMVFSQRDGEEDIDVSDFRRKLERLDGMALLPDPQGSYIIRSMETEPAEV